MPERCGFLQPVHSVKNPRLKQSYGDIFTLL